MSEQWYGVFIRVPPTTIRGPQLIPVKMWLHFAEADAQCNGLRKSGVPAIVMCCERLEEEE